MVIKQGHHRSCFQVVAIKFGYTFLLTNDKEMLKNTRNSQETSVLLFSGEKKDMYSGEGEGGEDRRTNYKSSIMWL